MDDTLWDDDARQGTLETVTNWANNFLILWTTLAFLLHVFHLLCLLIAIKFGSHTFFLRAIKLPLTFAMLSIYSLLFLNIFFEIWCLSTFGQIVLFISLFWISFVSICFVGLIFPFIFAIWDFKV